MKTSSLALKMAFKISSIDIFQSPTHAGHYANQWKVGTQKTYKCFIFVLIFSISAFSILQITK